MNMLEDARILMDIFYDYYDDEEDELTSNKTHKGNFDVILDDNICPHVMVKHNQRVIASVTAYHYMHEGVEDPDTNMYLDLNIRDPFIWQLFKTSNNY